MRDAGLCAIDHILRYVCSGKETDSMKGGDPHVSMRKVGHKEKWELKLIKFYVKTYLMDIPILPYQDVWFSWLPIDTHYG